MSSWECCKEYGSLCRTLCAAWFVAVWLLAGGVAADEIDSIRAMPTSVPISMPTSVNADKFYTNVPDWGGPYMGEPWTWQILPAGLVFRSYLANNREPRFAFQWVHEKDRGWLWDSALGGRVGLVRYGTRDPLQPRGWELDIEGAAFPRLKLDRQRDMISSDFRFGVPLTYRRGCWECKFAFYHLSSHLADEYIPVHPNRKRINYSRDVLTWATGYFPTENIRLYAECGWAWYADEGSDPWEFQFGIEYSPLYPNGFDGHPFFAINTRLRQEVDFGGNMTIQAGWQWRGCSGQRFRAGLQYFNGMSDQYQFVREFEEQIGGGVWYDF